MTETKADYIYKILKFMLINEKARTKKIINLFSDSGFKDGAQNTARIGSRAAKSEIKPVGDFFCRTNLFINYVFSIG
jgi:hypothetical protein